MTEASQDRRDYDVRLATQERISMENAREIAANTAAIRSLVSGQEQLQKTVQTLVSDLRHGSKNQLTVMIAGLTLLAIVAGLVVIAPLADLTKRVLAHEGDGHPHKVEARVSNLEALVQEAADDRRSQEVARVRQSVEMGERLHSLERAIFPKVKYRKGRI